MGAPEKTAAHDERPHHLADLPDVGLGGVAATVGKGNGVLLLDVVLVE